MVSGFHLGGVGGGRVGSRDSEGSRTCICIESYSTTVVNFRSGSCLFFFGGGGGGGGGELSSLRETSPCAAPLYESLGTINTMP